MSNLSLGDCGWTKPSYFKISLSQPSSWHSQLKPDLSLKVRAWDLGVWTGNDNWLCKHCLTLHKQFLEFSWMQPVCGLRRFEFDHADFFHGCHWDVQFHSYSKIVHVHGAAVDNWQIFLGSWLLSFCQPLKVHSGWWEWQEECFSLSVHILSISIISNLMCEHSQKLPGMSCFDLIFNGRYKVRRPNSILSLWKSLLKQMCGWVTGWVP